jgi:hypothetical protein
MKCERALWTVAHVDAVKCQNVAFVADIVLFVSSADTSITESGGE